MEIREMSLPDIPACAALEAQGSRTPWNETGLFTYYIREDARFLVAENEDEIVGHCGLLLIPDEAEILLLTVREDMRRQGIGKALLAAQAERAKEEGIRKLFLEVRESNLAALTLYESFGFHRIGIRKGYYDHPTEDAVTMAKEM